MATEAQKIRHAFQDGVKFGAVAGAEQMKAQVDALYQSVPWSPEAEEFYSAFLALDPKTIKVKP